MSLIDTSKALKELEEVEKLKEFAIRYCTYEETADDEEIKIDKKSAERRNSIIKNANEYINILLNDVDETLKLTVEALKEDDE